MTTEIGALTNIRYLFDPVTGSYQGIVRVSEVVSLPKNCTKIAPPFPGEPQIPIWDFANNVWKTVERGQVEMNSEIARMIRAENENVLLLFDKLLEGITRTNEIILKCESARQEDLKATNECVFHDLAQIRSNTHELMNAFTNFDKYLVWSHQDITMRLPQKRPNVFMRLYFWILGLS